MDSYQIDRGKTQYGSFITLNANNTSSSTLELVTSRRNTASLALDAVERPL